MRLLFVFLIAIWTTAATADLYRWVDPETGSVKYSSYPPPWFGDPLQERGAPRVERIPAGKATPNTPAQTATSSLEARYKEMLKALSVLPLREDFNRAGSGVRQQLEAYNAVATELDRLDPKGAEARRAESQPLLEKLIEGLRSQVSPRLPAVQ